MQSDQTAMFFIIANTAYSIGGMVKVTGCSILQNLSSIHHLLIIIMFWWSSHSAWELSCMINEVCLGLNLSNIIIQVTKNRIFGGLIRNRAIILNLNWGKHSRAFTDRLPFMRGHTSEKIVFILEWEWKSVVVCHALQLHCYWYRYMQIHILGILRRLLFHPMPFCGP